MDSSMHLKYLPIDAERGTIYSEDGNMLSTSVPVFDVYVDFAAEGLREKGGKRFKDHMDTLSTCLSNLFNDKTSREYLTEMQLAYKNKDRYYALKKKISFSQYKELRDFPLVNLGKNKSGFIIVSKDKRINP
jgi:cell division protein FtsI (penicillin-binding protein 3)